MTGNHENAIACVNVLLLRIATLEAALREIDRLERISSYERCPDCDHQPTDCTCETGCITVQRGGGTDALATKNAELDDQLNRARAQVLQAGNEKAALERQLAEQETRENESEHEWTDIVYRLVDAVGARRGKSIPEEVENAVAAIADLRRDAERWAMAEELTVPWNYDVQTSATGAHFVTGAAVRVKAGSLREGIDAAIAARKAVEAGEGVLLPESCEPPEPTP